MEWQNVTLLHTVRTSNRPFHIKVCPSVNAHCISKKEQGCQHDLHHGCVLHKQIIKIGFSLLFFPVYKFNAIQICQKKRILPDTPRIKRG